VGPVGPRVGPGGPRVGPDRPGVGPDGPGVGPGGPRAGSPRSWASRPRSWAGWPRSWARPPQRWAGRPPSWAGRPQRWAGRAQCWAGRLQRWARPPRATRRANPTVALEFLQDAQGALRRDDPRHPSGAAVDVEPVAAQEAYQSEAEALGQLDRQAARRRDGADDRHPGDQALLEDLIARPAADQDDVAVEREEPLAERPADQLVERVVAADVLAH